MEEKVVNEEAYDADQIQVLEGLEAVRKRPGMYIGSTSEKGLHHLVWEIIDNSIDEALAGHCDRIEVIIEADNSITVNDNGRGIPVDTHEQTGKSALEIIMTVLHAGGKFGGGGYKVSGGLHGVGASVVNALSETMDVYVNRDEKIYHLGFARGIPQGEVTVIGESEKTGTTVKFKPDYEIFAEFLIFEYDILAQRLRELAFLNKGITICLEDKRVSESEDEDEENKAGKSAEFYYEGGIRSYVEYMNRNRDVLHEPFYAEGSADDVIVEVAIQYNDGFSSNLYSYANNINTYEGGTHEFGFRTGLTRVVNDYARRNQIFKDGDENLTGDDVREGITAILSIKHPNPQLSLIHI